MPRVGAWAAGEWDEAFGPVVSHCPAGLPWHKVPCWPSPGRLELADATAARWSGLCAGDLMSRAQSTSRGGTAFCPAARHISSLPHAASRGPSACQRQERQSRATHGTETDKRTGMGAGNAAMEGASGPFTRESAGGGKRRQSQTTRQLDQAHRFGGEAATCNHSVVHGPLTKHTEPRARPRNGRHSPRSATQSPQSAAVPPPP